MTVADPRRDERAVRCVDCERLWFVSQDEDIDTTRIRCPECGQVQIFADARQNWVELQSVDGVRVVEHKKENKNGEIVLDLHRIAKDIRAKFHFFVLKDRKGSTVDVVRYDANAGIYKKDGRDFLNHIIEVVFRDRGTVNLKNEMFQHLRDQGFTYLDKWLGGSSPHIAVSNGVIDLQQYAAGEPCLHEWGPEHHLFSRLDVVFDPTAQDELLRNHLLLVIPDESDRDRFQKFVGSFLEPGNYAHQKILILTGNEGSGKTVTLRLFTKFFGMENITAKTFQQLSTNKFAIADLFGSLANICEELPRDTLRSVERLNSLTGGLVDGERKGRDPFVFYQNSKLATACNDLPPLDADTTTIRALMSRLIIIVFDKIIRGTSEEVQNYDDVILGQKSGIFNWILAGYRKYVSGQRKIAASRSTEETLEFYIASADFEAYFLAGCVEKGGRDDYVVRDALYLAYLKAAELKKHATRSKQTFLAKVVQKFGGAVSSGRHSVGVGANGKPDRPYVFFGIRLKPEEKWFKTDTEEADE